LIGDYNAKVIAHQAIPQALRIAASANQLNVEFQWLSTVSLGEDVSKKLSSCQGVWCVPASPYKNMDGALAAIQYAREHFIPFLGTCGGYQHAILEFARNVLNLTQADHAEVNPDTDFPLISQLVCSMIGENGKIFLLENSKIQAVYNQLEISEQYNCSYGFNRNYLDLFAGCDLMISGFDVEGDPRCIELTNHPFFIGTAYQPERSALDGNNHPLVNQFILSTLSINNSNLI